MAKKPSAPSAWQNSAYWKENSEAYEALEPQLWSMNNEAIMSLLKSSFSEKGYKASDAKNVNERAKLLDTYLKAEKLALREASLKQVNDDIEREKKEREKKEKEKGNGKGKEKEKEQSDTDAQPENTGESAKTTQLAERARELDDIRTRREKDAADLKAKNDQDQRDREAAKESETERRIREATEESDRNFAENLKKQTEEQARAREGKAKGKGKGPGDDDSDSSDDDEGEWNLGARASASKKFQRPKGVPRRFMGYQRWQLKDWAVVRYGMKGACMHRYELMDDKLELDLPRDWPIQRNLTETSKIWPMDEVIEWVGVVFHGEYPGTDFTNDAVACLDPTLATMRREGKMQAMREAKIVGRQAKYRPEGNMMGLVRSRPGGKDRYALYSFSKFKAATKKGEDMIFDKYKDLLMSYHRAYEAEIGPLEKYIVTEHYKELALKGQFPNGSKVLTKEDVEEYVSAKKKAYFEEQENNEKEKNNDDNNEEQLRRFFNSTSEQQKAEIARFEEIYSAMAIRLKEMKTKPGDTSESMEEEE